MNGVLDGIEAGGPLLTARDVHHRFGALEVLADVDLNLAAGERTAVVGPSGCGKSTLLRILAGLEQPTRGRVGFLGVSGAPPDGRRSLMFQGNALYPWMSLQDNVGFALEARGASRSEAQARAREALAAVELDGFERYRPQHVSGGMRQRAALARALISDPVVVLLDEPFAALDALARARLQDLALARLAEARSSMLLVTHDVDEALYLARSVLVMSRRPGRLVARYAVPTLPAAERGDARLAPLRRDIHRLLGLEAGTTTVRSSTDAGAGTPPEVSR